jgi:CobQ-like glutamine amidotransferase family enzyme
VVLAICAGFQIMGESFYAQGNKHDGLAHFAMTTIPGQHRFVGDIKLRSALLGIEITGFENHGGATTIAEGLAPFGEVIRGHGNGDSKVDGAISGNHFGTYLHGPILARNPEFADLLLARAIGNSLPAFDDELANRYALARRSAL